jgi:Glycosyl transferases group 1
MQKADPFVVLCWETDSCYMPPPRLSPRQFTIGIVYGQPSNIAVCAEPLSTMVPTGAYDLEATLRASGIAETPDLIVVWTTSVFLATPVNLGAFRCPKLLLCSDTHQFPHPIRRLLNYARAEAFDAVASVFDRHHLHWFLAAGFAQSAWLPGITVQHMAPPWQTQRIDQVGFVGQMAPSRHAWRKALLKRVAKAGIPLCARQSTRAQSAAMYAQSLVSFNASLSGDLNMRVFEVLSAGGFLLTDRLSPQAGFELLLCPGHDCETYGDAEELLDKIAFYRRSPAAALRIAEQGAATYRTEHLAEHRITVLREWMLDGRLPDRFNPRHDLRLAASQAAAGQLELRITIYEMLQELQQLQSSSSVLVSPGWPLASVMDLADLMRVRVTVIEPAPALRAAAAAASVLDQLAFIDADAAARQDWDIVLTASADGADEPWRRRAGRVWFAEFGDGRVVSNPNQIHEDP